MTYQFTISPDFNAQRISDLFIFNTWLQQSLGESIHLELYDDFKSQRRAIAEEKVDLIYSNPYDAAELVRRQKFLPVVRPSTLSDEAVIAVSAGGAIHTVEELKPGARIASTNDPDVHTIAMIMLEPAELNSQNVTIGLCESYPLVARDLIEGTADVGFFLKTMYDDLTPVIQRQLRVICTSHIGLVKHAFLVGPKFAHKQADLIRVLLGMGATEDGKSILEGIGIPGWERLKHEEMEFMIDLMDTLVEKPEE